MKLRNVHEDFRGSINILTGFRNFEEATVFQTLKGYARGGCIHNINDERFVVLDGLVDFYLGDIKKSLNVGNSIIITRGRPHYFVAVTDCVVMEWGATAEEKKDKHITTRKIVERINAKSD